MLRDVMMRGQERELTLQTLVAMQALLNKNKKVLLLGKKKQKQFMIKLILLV
jgi:hypothetical protein